MVHKSLLFVSHDSFGFVIDLTQSGILVSSVQNEQLFGENYLL